MAPLMREISIIMKLMVTADMRIKNKIMNMWGNLKMGPGMDLGGIFLGMGIGFRGSIGMGLLGGLGGRFLQMGVKWLRSIVTIILMGLGSIMNQMESNYLENSP